MCPLPCDELQLPASCTVTELYASPQMTINGDCKLVEVPRFLPMEWKNAMDWYDATVRPACSLLMDHTLTGSQALYSP